MATSNRILRRITTGAAVTFVALSWQAVSGAPWQQAPRVLIDSLAGRDSFELYCAACHGSDGRGHGPVAPGLRTAPADLTLLARRNNGAFPRDRVREFIVGTGRPLTSHGASDMPVWGGMFGAFESDARVRERIVNLVTFIERLQQPSTGPDDPGSRLFQTHCASCHGLTARGGGPVASHLRPSPPDLTQFTRRNGGMFPRERVYRIIDGRDVSVHGSGDMPVWGDVFKTLPGGASPAAVKARIDAIVRYLEGIQERSL
jgi:mono/diheme cytochrome c family protein